MSTRQYVIRVLVTMLALLVLLAAYHWHSTSLQRQKDREAYSRIMGRAMSGGFLR